MGKDDSIYCRHILDSTTQIEEYIRGITRKGFLENKMVQDAVIRQIQIIGEATKNISPEFRKKYPSIPWRDIAGMRDKLSHDYLGVDIAAVWATVESDLPKLKKQVNSLLQKL